MSSPASPSGQPFNIAWSHQQPSPSASGGDPLDVASHAQKIDKVTFLSEALPAGGDTMDINVFVNGASILAGAVPFSITDTSITTTEIDVPLNGALTQLSPGDRITVTRAAVVGVGMGANMINVYKNDGDDQQPKKSPSGFDKRQVFATSANITNTQVANNAIAQYALFNQFVGQIDFIIDQAMAAGETITLDIFRNGVAFIAPFVFTDTGVPLVNVSVPFANGLTIVRGDIFVFRFTYSAGVGGLRTMQARIVGD